MASDGVNKTWEARVARIIRERETVTDISGQADLTSAEESYFDVLELFPDRSNKAEKYLLSGNEEMLALQTSLLLAIRQMLGGASTINLDKWIEEFEDGFPKAKGKPKHLSDTAKPWGKDKDSRPKITRLSSDGYELIGLYPDRKVLDEFYVFAGNAAQVIQQVHQFWAMYSADFGDTFVGYPVEEYLRRSPKSGIHLQIVLIPVTEPTNKGSFHRQKVGSANSHYYLYPSQVTIPYPKRSKIAYATLRETCGGSTGLNWGNWQARAYLSLQPTSSQKGLSQLVVRGSSKDVADKNLDKFLELTDGIVASRTCTEVKLNAGIRKDDPRSKFLNSYPLYPGWVLVENSQLVRADDLKHDGHPTLSGKQVGKDGQLYIFREAEPPWWKERLTELLKSPLS